MWKCRIFTWLILNVTRCLKCTCTLSTHTVGGKRNLNAVTSALRINHCEILQHVLQRPVLLKLSPPHSEINCKEWKYIVSKIYRSFSIFTSFSLKKKTLGYLELLKLWFYETFSKLLQAIRVWHFDNDFFYMELWADSKQKNGADEFGAAEFISVLENPSVST